MGAAKRLTDTSREDRFRQEIAAYSALDHPNVLKVFDEGIASKARPYLVSEFCELGELKQETMKGMTTLERVKLFRQICDGVAAAHSARIVHRDIKPENILVKAGLTPVVADFGICFLTEQNRERLTEPDHVMASRHFGAPEARNGRVRDVKATADV
jgi:serine/threonine protein kinase